MSRGLARILCRSESVFVQPFEDPTGARVVRHQLHHGCRGVQGRFPITLDEQVRRGLTETLEPIVGGGAVSDRSAALGSARGRARRGRWRRRGLCWLRWAFIGLICRPGSR